MGSPSRNVQYHPPRLSEDRLNLAQPHSPSLPTHCSGKSGMRPVPVPLVASDGGGEAFGSPSRFRDGVDHRFVATLVASGVRRAGTNATRRLLDARFSAVESLPPAGRRPVCRGRDRALTASAAARALTCARNRVRSTFFLSQSMGCRRRRWRWPVFAGLGRRWFVSTLVWKAKPCERTFSRRRRLSPLRSFFGWGPRCSRR